MPKNFMRQYAYIAKKMSETNWGQTCQRAEAVLLTRPVPRSHYFSSENE